MRRWAVMTAAIWLLVMGTLLIFAALVGAREGTLGARINDFFWLALLAVTLIGVLPAYWWRRMDGSVTMVLAIAVGVPLTASVPFMVPMSEGSYGSAFNLVVGAAILAIAFVASLLIAFFVVPAEEKAG